MEILVIDGYNIIGAWDELRVLKDEDISMARDRLIEMMADYKAFSGRRVIIVFDAYYVQGTAKKHEKFNLEIIYTKENETADECIERLIRQLKNVQTKVYVATSDYTEQRTIFSLGALRKSARELYIELTGVHHEIGETIEANNKTKPNSKIKLPKEVMEKFEKMRRGKM